MGVRVAVRSYAGDAVLGALAVDSVGAVAAVGTGDALVLRMRLVTAEFSLFVTVSVRVAVGAKLGFAVRG